MQLCKQGLALNCAGGLQSIGAKILEVVEPALPEAGHLARPVEQRESSKVSRFRCPGDSTEGKIPVRSKPSDRPCFSGFSNSRRRCSTSLLY